MVTYIPVKTCGFIVGSVSVENASVFEMLNATNSLSILVVTLGIGKNHKKGDLMLNWESHNKVINWTENSEGSKEKLKKQNFQIYVALSVFCVTAWLFIIACGVWLINTGVPWLWSNLVWLWDAGPEYLHFARWGMLASACGMLWFCAVGLVENWRRP